VRRGARAPPPPPPPHTPTPPPPPKTTLGDAAAWCVSVFNDKGDRSASPEGYKYPAAGGLEEGQC